MALLVSLGDPKSILHGALAVAVAVCGIPPTPAVAQDYRQAYSYALRCFVVANSAKDDAGARRAFDTAMRLGRLQKLSNRQLNSDLDEAGASELVKMLRDPVYKARMLAACRKMGLAS